MDAPDHLRRRDPLHDGRLRRPALDLGSRLDRLGGLLLGPGDAGGVGDGACEQDDQGDGEHPPDPTPAALLAAPLAEERVPVDGLKDDGRPEYAPFSTGPATGARP